jgi:hypothetical protein
VGRHGITGANVSTGHNCKRRSTKREYDTIAIEIADQRRAIAFFLQKNAHKEEHSNNDNNKKTHKVKIDMCFSFTATSHAPTDGRHTTLDLQSRTIRDNNNNNNNKQTTTHCRRLAYDAGCV